MAAASQEEVQELRNDMVALREEMAQMKEEQKKLRTQAETVVEDRLTDVPTIEEFLHHLERQEKMMREEQVRIG